MKVLRTVFLCALLASGLVAFWGAMTETAEASSFACLCFCPPDFDTITIIWSEVDCLVTCEEFCS